MEVFPKKKFCLGSTEANLAWVSNYSTTPDFNPLNPQQLQPVPWNLSFLRPFLLLIPSSAPSSSIPD